MKRAVTGFSALLDKSVFLGRGKEKVKDIAYLLDFIVVAREWVTSYEVLPYVTR